MKIGSVQFFKVLIVGTAIFLVLLLLGLCIMFVFVHARQKERIALLEEENSSLHQLLEQASAVPDALLPPSLSQQSGQASSAVYDSIYPHLYARPLSVQPTNEKICYLTFDDGPSGTTRLVLDVLAEYDVSATFFVTGLASVQLPDLLREAAEAGHTVGVHSYSHDYEQIYASTQAFLADFDLMHSQVQQITGIAPGIFRFAGGSVNNYNKEIRAELTAEMLRRGFIFFDWNVAGDDAVAGEMPAEKIVSNVLEGARDLNRAIVLLHDRSDTATTAEALPAIIEGLQQQGFRFAPLTSAVVPVIHPS